ncbi:MAG: porin [Planctomycetes bacterium]|nr:porin [Planctomycetota bacterium]
MSQENRRLGQRIQDLVEENRRLSNRPRVAHLPADAPDDVGNETDSVPETEIYHPAPAVPLNPYPDWLGNWPPNFTAGYDHGFLIQPTNPHEHPFSFKFNNQTQLRYTGFARDVVSWTDNAGITYPVSDRSNFEIPRGRAIFSGYAFLPDLTYNLNIDYNTVTSNPINFRAYWLAYRFNRGLTVFLGQNKVPGTREWLITSTQVLGPDRSMATTFFRPSLSQGIWATGEPRDGLFYHFMIANGFNTLGSNPTQLDSHMAGTLSVWAEPWGAFGTGYGDFESHASPALRLGTSITYSPEQGQQGNPDAAENAAIRLTDGTLLTETGALAPGVTLNIYYVGLAAFDLAFKYRGFSMSGEFFLRDLFGLQGNGPLPRTSIFDYGAFAQTGYYVIPQTFELYARTSQVTGPYGSGAEYAGGLNWFFLPDRQNLRYTLDCAWLDQCPADQNRTDYQAGYTGLLVRSQIQFFF